MVISSYTNFFSLFIYALFLIPAVVLGLLGKKIKSFKICDAMKWYGMIISIPMIVLLFGLTSRQMFQFIVFILCEILLIYTYSI